MWDQYKKTFAGMQIAIAAMSAAIHVQIGGRWPVTAVFVVVMQVAAFAGAAWAARLRRKIQARPS
jgi:hypothetical protein